MAYTREVLEALAAKDENQIPRGIGRSHGTSRSVAFDRWFRYPAGFSSDTVTTILSLLQVEQDDWICDPFAGSGVVGTATRELGLNFYGIEAHPLIAELAKTKLRRPPRNPDALRVAGRLIAQSAVRRIRSAKSPSSLGTDEHELVKQCFEPKTLAALVAIRRSVDVLDNGAWKPWLRWALIGTLRDVASVRVGWPYQLPSQARKPVHKDPMLRFTARVGLMADDLTHIAGDIGSVKSKIVVGDSQKKQSWERLSGLASGSASSPPYLNNFDYADATRLEMYFLKEADSWASLSSVARSDMVIATTQQSSKLTEEAAWGSLEGNAVVTQRLRNIAKLLSAERHARTRGKEYDRVLPAYFAGLDRVIERLAENLSAGSVSAWLVGDSAPYGVYVDTPDLLTELAVSHGFEPEADVTLRKRGMRWAGVGTRHSVPLAERLILWRKS